MSVFHRIQLLTFIGRNFPAKKFAKPFALRPQVYYNKRKNTVAHATESQKGGEGPGKTSRNGYGKLSSAVTIHLSVRRAGSEALRVLLGEVGAVLRTYSRGETLVLAGQPNRRVGVVLSGAIEAYHSAASGARLPISQMGPGGVFGDVLGARAFPAR